MQSYDPVFGTLRRDWPDGRSLWLDANGSAVTEAELTAVADGPRNGHGTVYRAPIEAVLPPK